MDQQSVEVSPVAKKTYKDTKGYVRFADSGRKRATWAAEKKVGGKIYSGRVVHHRDGNKSNDSPGNLRVMRRDDHSRLHVRSRKK